MEKTQGEFRRVVGQLRMAVMRHRLLRPRDKLVAAVMLEHLDRKRWERTGELLTWDGVGVEALADAAALSTRDVERARSALQAAGVIELRRKAVPAQGKAAQFQFRADFVADSRVGDTRVGYEVSQPPESGVVADKTPDSQPTRESAIPCKTRILGRAGAHARARAGEGRLAALLAEHFSPAEIANWLAPCRMVLDGGTVTIWAPTRFVRDWIDRPEFRGRVRDALGVYDVDVRLGTPPGAHPPPLLRAEPEGRA